MPIVYEVIGTLSVPGNSSHPGIGQSINYSFKLDYTHLDPFDYPTVVGTPIVTSFGPLGHFSLGTPARTPASSARSSAPTCGSEINYYHLWLQGPAARELYDGNRSEFYNQIKRINQLCTASPRARCRTARRGSSSGWASTWNGPARRPAFWT